MKIDLSKYEIWFITGSQHLYGTDTLKQVDKNSLYIVKYFDESGKLPCKIVFKPVVKTPDEIYKICLDANTAENCVGLIIWMHTFSPAKMWIAGLNILKKPFAHLHTQFNRDIPWSTIDMDFMNLNQSAHGDREFGFICTRMRKNRKVIVGHWQDEDVLKNLNIWSRAACAFHDSQGLKICRFGDNMREVAVTEGDKVEAQMKFGYSVNGYGLGDIVKFVDEVGQKEINALIEEYSNLYELSNNVKKSESLKDAAQIEIGMRALLEDGGFNAFTTTFENLYGLQQLPGLAVQRLMADGFGFGAEGDWKTAALVRAMKVMAACLKGGTSFMEDYTYHFGQENMMVLGAHMLEVCPSIAADKPRLEVFPLSIGGKKNPARLIFDAPAGRGLNATIVDLGDRFRMIVNEIEVVESKKPLPKLPVARALWIPVPNLKTAAEAWILGGGAHHTGFTMALSSEYMQDFANIANIECLMIDSRANIPDFINQCRWNEMYYDKN